MEQIKTNFTKESCIDSLIFNNEHYYYYSLKKLNEICNINLFNLPFSKKLLLEINIRNLNYNEEIEPVIEAIVNPHSDIKFFPYRVLLQDFTGVPTLLDILSIEESLKNKAPKNSERKFTVPIDLVLDHSLVLKETNSKDSFHVNLLNEYENNKERYEFVKWAKGRFKNLNVIPPSSGIVHQINLEYLSKLLIKQTINNKNYLIPDSLIGTDSHTTMINGLGVLGWGVGGIEAIESIYGDSIHLSNPIVTGIKLTGNLSNNSSSTDLALSLVKFLRDCKVNDQFIEFFGPGLKNIDLPDRATISNMAPEYGAIITYFPIDSKTIEYLHLTGRDANDIKLIKEYYENQNLIYDDYNTEPTYDRVLEFNLESVEPNISGPRNPNESIPVGDVQEIWNKILYSPKEKNGYGKSIENAEVYSKQDENLKDGSIVLASITSCTNTSNPVAMISAGLIARNALKKGLKIPSYVKTSFTPGSKVVTEYLKQSNLIEYLEDLGFGISGYACGACNGNGGNLKAAVNERNFEDLILTSITSGNRNFEGRIHPLIKANFLASPALVIAYAIAGTIDININDEPLGVNSGNESIYLKDIWPDKTEVDNLISDNINPDLYRKNYSNITAGDQLWKSVLPKNPFEVAHESTYIKVPSFYEKHSRKSDIKKGRVLLYLGDSLTTDHISPGGLISKNNIAGQYLLSKNVAPGRLNSFGSRRGNHEVMVRGAFSNPHLINKISPEKKGGYTKHFPSNQTLPIYEAAMKYKIDNTPLVIIAGRSYGAGSSRDWAAKATFLLGIKVVIAESFERIHRRNLIKMGILPLEIIDIDSFSGMNITGAEKIDIIGIENISAPNQIVNVIISDDFSTKYLKTIAKLENDDDISTYNQSGVFSKIIKRYENDLDL